MSAKKSAAGYVGITLFVVFLFFVIYDIYKTPYLRITAIAVPAVVFALNFHILFGDWIPVRRGATVFTASGLVGTQIKQPIKEYDGIETRIVAFQRDQVHFSLKREREGGLYWFYDMIYATVTIPLRGKTGVDWIPVNDDDNENPNGAVWYMKRIDGGEIRNPDIIGGHSHLKRQAIIISRLFTEFQIIEEQVANIANMKNMDIDTMSSKLQLIADRVKNVKIIAKGRGGEAETMASELN